MSLDPGSSSGSPMSERMQALLSRAVEDQVSEQRQIATLVSEVRNYVAQIGSEIEALRANPPGSTGELERSLAGVSADIREAIRVLGERIDGVSSLVQQRGHDLADIRGIVETDVRPRVDALDATMREIRGAFAGVAARVADLPVRADVEAMVGRTGQATADLPDRVKRIEGSLDELHEGLLGEDGLHARLAAMGGPAEPPDVHGAVNDAVATSAPQIAAAVQQSVNETLQHTLDQSVSQRVEAAVARAVADSEQRLSEHIDEAVLALAEALLRRRAARPPASPFDTGEIQAITADFTAATNQPASAPPASLQREEPAAAPPVAEPLEHGDADYQAAVPDAHEMVTEAPAQSEPTQPQATQPEPTQSQPTHVDLEADREPAAVAADGGLRHALDDDDEGRKRRPWWRPSE
jgi:hypothetical protein